MTTRRIPSSGSKACASKKNEGIIGKNGSYLRVLLDKEMCTVEKVFSSNWTKKGNEQFKRQYLNENDELTDTIGLEDNRLEWIESIKKGILSWRDVLDKKLKEVGPDESDESLELSEIYEIDSELEDDEITFNFHYDGNDYHRDNENFIYTTEGEIFGFIDNDGNVIVNDDEKNDDIQNKEVIIECDNSSVPDKSVVKEEKKSKHLRNYEPEEDAIIIGYMLDSHTENKNGCLREKKVAKKFRELSQQLPGRKPQNIQTRWERYLHPKYLQTIIDERDAEIVRLKKCVNLL